MSRSLSPDLRNALAERVRYYREMGIYDFYSRDAGLHSEHSPANVNPDEISEEPATQREPMSPKKSALASPEPVFEVLTAKPEFNVSDSIEALHIIREDLGDCTRCRLHQQGRKQIVFGVGTPNADLMFI